MTSRVKGLVVATFLVLSSIAAFAGDGPDQQIEIDYSNGGSLGRCQLGCACYYATYREGQCGTISDSGCYVLQCCCV